MTTLKLLISTALFIAATTQAQSQGGTPMPMKPATQPSVAPSTMPLVDGDVRKIDLAKHELVLKHGDLPNLGMPAMIMAFSVADRKMLDRVKVGDKVRFNAEMLDGKPTVTRLEAVK